MLIVPYYNRPPEPRSGPMCVHLQSRAAPLQRESGQDVWLESFDPEALLREAARGGSVTLNSLWLDNAVWEAYAGSLALFRRVILMPYDPANPELPYETAAERVLERAVSHGIPRKRLIVDLCILPYARRSSLDTYAGRAEWVRDAFGVSITAGLDNVVYREPAKLPLLSELLRLLAARIDYGLISARYAPWAMLFTDDADGVMTE